MKILQTVSSLNQLAGGTASCVDQLVRALNGVDCPCEVLTYDHGGEFSPGTPVIAITRDTVTPYGYSRNVRKFLSRAEGYDLFHTNGMWLDINHATCAYARKLGKPYVITPHGMLYPQAMARGYWHKQLFYHALFRRDLQKAACVLLTCEAEREHFRKLNLRVPTAVIPNAIEIPDFIDDIRRDDSVRRIGYLGRLHPRKGVEKLISAWGKVSGDRPDTELCIAGEGDAEYEKLLRDRVLDLGLQNVRFCGFLRGREKFEFLASLSALCNPSNFENFGMVIPEALIVRTPAIAGINSPWQMLVEHQAGDWIDPTVENIQSSLEKFLSMSSTELRDMGERGRQLVLDNFAPEVVATKLKRLYAWCIAGGEAPEFVQKIK